MNPVKHHPVLGEEFVDDGDDETADAALRGIDRGLAERKKSMTTRFFALLNPAWGTVENNAIGLFREVRDDRGLGLERLGKDGEWKGDDANLAAYIYQGEPGAEEIDEATAKQLAKRLVNVQTW